MLRAAAIAVVVSAASVAAAPASAAPSARVERIAGMDRAATAAAIAARIDDDTVMIASGETFPDALAASASGHPVLLVTRDRVPVATRNELDRRRPAHVVVVGGTAAISDEVARAVGAGKRVAGVDRYATARLLAAGDADAYEADGRSYALAAPVAAAATRDGVGLRLVDHDVAAPPPAPVGADVVLASAASFADALTAATLGRTLLLTEPDCVPGDVLAEIERIDPGTITLVGGTAALSPAVGDLVPCAPSSTITFEFGADVTSSVRADVHEAVDAVIRRWGDPGPVLVQAYADVDDLAEANARAEGDTAEEWLDWWSDGTLAMGDQGWLAVNLDAVFEWDESSAWLMLVVAHEMGHVEEFRSDPWIDAPAWLVEGGAEWIAVETGLAEGWFDEDDELYELYIEDATDPAYGPLEEYEEGSDDLGEYGLGWAGCEYLAELAGPDALLTIFDDLGAGADWEDELALHTGLDVDEFYASFAAWLTEL